MVSSALLARNAGRRDTPQVGYPQVGYPQVRSNQYKASELCTNPRDLQRAQCFQCLVTLLSFKKEHCAQRPSTIFCNLVTLIM